VNSHGPCGEFRQSLAVYVLGAIEPADRDAVHRHLAACRDCRQELAGLAGLPALLRKVPQAEAVALAAADASFGRREDLPSGDTLRYLLGQTGKHRRKGLRTRAAAASAAGLVAGAAMIAGWHAAHSSAQPPVASAPRWAGTAWAASPLTRATAILKFAARPWGVQLGLRITGIPVGTTCELEVIGENGQTVTAGSWTITSGPANWYPASASLPLSQVRDFVVTSGSRILVTVPIRADARVSSRSPAGRSW
jgi:hypothetical protein